VANLLLGRLAEAGEAADAALESARLGHPQTQIWALTVHCWVDVLKGDLARAVAMGEEATAIVERAGAGLFSWVAYACLAMALLDAGEPARARDLILRHAGGADLDLVDRGWRTHWYTTLALAELELGKVDAARHWADRAEAAAEAFPARGRVGQARYARAAVELRDGGLRHAAELALGAAEDLTTAGFPIEAARARILAGQALGELGDSSCAIEVLRSAHAALSACGARGYRDEAARELRRLGEKPRRTHGPGGGGLDALTQREREVAELVARGMSNRDIGEALSVSTKTVESHMTRILAKAGVPSRAGLAAAVHRWRRERGA
jgi:DNA-binding CsgD family transcriptional regulator